MKVKELQKTVNIAWSPQQQNPIYLAAGTAAQQLDSSANSTLEIYSTNFSDPSYDLELKASLPSQYRFQKLIWSPTGWDGAHRNGLLVGGCEGGHVMIYSAAKMLAGEEGLVARQDKHSGAVTGLDVNPFQKNLLASCASESEIFIWDLNNTSTHMSPGTKTQPLEDVKSVAWNRQVQHILASVFSTRCVIWDLRKSEQIIKLSDTQSRVRWHAIQWHPDVATQVWLASEDDAAPVVQLWDLRYATAPAKTLQIHQRGMLGMSWCPQDADLMVSCGKDNRIYCWNPNQTEQQQAEAEGGGDVILSEVATTATWYSDVQWCPRNPALIASSSLDGNVSVYSLFGGTQQQVQTSNKIADSFPGMEQFAQAPMPQQATHVVYHDLKRAPKWIKRPCGVAWGFGGKLISFNDSSKSVALSQVVTEPELVERANALERSMADTNYAEYCRQRADQTKEPEGRYLWYFIKANFEADPKEEMLNLLGYNREDADHKFAKYVKSDAELDEAAPPNGVDGLTNRLAALTHSDSSEVEGEQSITDGSTDALPSDGGALFDDIAADALKQQQQEASETKAPRPKFKIPNGEHADSLITEALLTGNLEAAVTLCLDTQRTAEALIIASTAGIEFLTRIQERYLRQREQESHSELASVIAALVERDWLDFVQRCTVDSWKEALVAALRHSERKAADICERLGDRLLEECAGSVEYTRHAMLCFVCAGNLDKLVTAWYRLKQLEHADHKNEDGSGDADGQPQLNVWELQELAEVALLMSKSLEQQGVSVDLGGRFADFIGQYGELLASQGALTAALAYIFALGGASESAADDGGVVGELRDRIYSTVHGRRAATGTGGHPQQQQQQQQQPQQATNMYGRQPAQQQQQRGSFSQPAVPTIPGPYGSALQNQFQQQPNAWNPPMPGSTLPPPVAAPPQIPTVFNPAARPAQALMPPMAGGGGGLPNVPLANEAVTHPTRPLSTASSQGASSAVGGGGPPTGGSGLLSRSKYVLDPSVASQAPHMGGYGGGMYNPLQNAPAAVTPMTGVPSASGFNNNPFPVGPLGGGGGVPMPQPAFNSTPFGVPAAGLNNPYMQGVPPIESASVAAAQPPMQNIQRNPTPPPGWNDPPALKSSSRQRYAQPSQEMSARHAGTRKWQKIIDHDKTRPTVGAGADGGGAKAAQSQSYHNAFSANYSSPSLYQEFFQPKPVHEPPGGAGMGPITHPLLGVDPNQNQNQNQNGYYDPNAAYQQATGGMPPPPMNAAAPPSSGGYYNPNASTIQSNNNAPPPNMGMVGGPYGAPSAGPATTFQPAPVPAWNTQTGGQFGYTEQPAAVHHQPVAPRQPEPPKEKPPLPEEYMYMQTVLDELKTQCLAAASDPRMKRKFVDVAKRLENLYDCLRDRRLSTTTIAALNEIVQFIQIGNYPNAMQTQAQLAFGADFSQCAGFMPGLKVLVQSAADLQIYLR